VKEEHQNFEEFKSDVESLCDWLHSLAIKFEKGRVAQYLRTQKAISEHIAKGNPADSESSVDFAQQADNFHDVSELLFIKQQLGDYDSKAFKTTLQLAVKGPILLADETPETSDARNRVFELAMAGRLREAGFKPRFVEPADAVVTVDGITCSLECKRIQSEVGLEDAIEHSYSQTKHRIKDSLANARGLIAVDISKIINPTGAQYFSATSSDHLAQIVEQRLTEFVERNRQKFHKNFYPFISSILIYLRTPAVTQEGGEHLVNYRRLAIFPSFRNEGKNKQVLRFLRKRLEGVSK
jgi:hypothetical protein